MLVGGWQSGEKPIDKDFAEASIELSDQRDCHEENIDAEKDDVVLANRAPSSTQTHYALQFALATLTIASWNHVWTGSAKWICSIKLS
jgi:hypothetical protein